jgi:hypothetical protein
MDVFVRTCYKLDLDRINPLKEKEKIRANRKAMAKAKVSPKARAKAKEIKVKDSSREKANHRPKAMLRLDSSRLNHNQARLIMGI